MKPKSEPCCRPQSRAGLLSACILMLVLSLVGEASGWADELPGGNAGNTIVAFEIRRGTNMLGRMNVELLDQEKPETVRNFLLYVRSGAYTNSFLHRCVPGFVVQGGGFWVTNSMGADRFSTYLTVTNYGKLTNEYSVGTRFSNTLGTLAMAKVGNDPNSATSQWFFNLGDNSTNLDTQNGGFTVFGRVLASTNANEGLSVLEHFNTLSTNAGIVNLGTLVGTNYQVFSALPVSYTNSITRVPLYRELYYTRISVLNETNQPGQTPPTVTILSPPPNSLFTNQPVTVSGTATDDLGVAKVVYCRQGGPLETATGTTNWTFTIPPQPGFNSVTVQSIDWEGNYSPGAFRSFYYEAALPLALQILGQGTVSGLTNGQILRAGEYCTATAVPAKSYVFDGWTGSITSATATVTFQVPTSATNFNLTAKFITDPLPQLTGTYNGLFQSLMGPSLDAAGFLSLTLQADGRFSGSILYHGTTYNYTGQFDSGGNASVSGVMEGVSRTISLQLQRTNTAGLITGTFSGTSSTTLVQLDRLASALPTTNAPPPGQYTFVIPAIPTNPPSSALPAGNGFGTGTLTSAGTLTLSGVLGDGTAFSISPKLTRIGRWPVYTTLEGGAGALLGWISPVKGHPEELEGSLQWIRSATASAKNYPRGFSNIVSFAASPYSAPTAGTRVLNWVYGLAQLSGTDLMPNLTNLVKLSTNNTLTVVEPNSTGLRLDWELSSGRVHGSFVHPWFGTTNQLEGTVLKVQNSIRGQYMSGSQVGSLNLEVTPFLVTQTVASVTLPAFEAALSEGGWIRFEADGLIVLTNTLTPPFGTMLDANGHSIVISGNGTTRLFEVQTNLEFSASGIRFANGFQAGSRGIDGSPPLPGGDGLGAGILNRGGSVALTNCIITNCVVLGGDAGIETSTNNANGIAGRGLGAAICNLGGQVSLQTCTIADCVATAGKGGSRTAMGLAAKTSGIALGGALFSDTGECEILDSRFMHNRAEGAGPLLLPSGGYGTAGDAAGGAIAVVGGRLRLISSQCLTNAAEGCPAADSVGSGSGYGGGLFLETNVLAVLDKAVFSGNSATAGPQSQAGDPGMGKGGAIFNAGSLEMRDCTFEQNLALGGPGNPGGQALGGALASVGSLVVNSTTFDDNIAQGGAYTGAQVTPAAGGKASGAAIHAAGGAVCITNSTFAFNTAIGGGVSEPGAPTNAVSGDAQGGALTTVSNSTILVHVTLAFNDAAPGPGSVVSGSAIGGALANLNGTLKLRSSILASNAPANIHGGIVDLGYNLCSDTSVVFTAAGSLTNADPLLGPLTANGGPTRTVAILPQSPARDAVRGSYPPLDQRGTARPQGTNADSGAFEFVQTLPVLTIQPSGTNTVMPGTNITFRVQADGAVPISFYWWKDDAPIGGATNATLGLTNIQYANAGSYWAVATNSFGAATSAVTVLVVDPRPVILAQPGDVLLPPGGTTSLVVTASGPELAYAWLHNQTLVPNSSGPILPITGTPEARGTYQVVITNSAGAVTSRLASITFSSAALSILTQPQDTTVAIGGVGSLSVLASGIAPFGYQWLRNGTPVPDATNSVLSFAYSSLTNAGTYRVVITNAFLSVTSSPAVLSVVGPPRLSIAFAATNLLVTCFGEPGRVHRLLRSENLEAGSAWTPVATNSIPGTGRLTWVQNAPTNGNPIYYRAVTP